MALSSSALKSLIISELTNQGFQVSNSEWPSKFAEAVAKAVVDHIKASAQVTVTCTDPISGPIPGQGTVS